MDSSPGQNYRTVPPAHRLRRAPHEERQRVRSRFSGSSVRRARGRREAGSRCPIKGPETSRTSRRRATFAEDRHVIAEEAAVELPERSALADQLVGEATLFEREECQEMAEHTGGVSGIGNVAGIEEARQAPVAQEEPGGEPGSRGCPASERLLAGVGLFEGDPGCAN